MKPHEEKRSRFFEAFSRVLLLSMRHKWTTIITTIVLFRDFRLRHGFH